MQASTISFTLAKVAVWFYGMETRTMLQGPAYNAPLVLFNMLEVAIYASNGVNTFSGGNIHVFTCPPGWVALYNVTVIGPSTGWAEGPFNATFTYLLTAACTFSGVYNPYGPWMPARPMGTT